MRERLPPALDGERVDRVVSLLTGMSRAEASRLVEAGGVRVNGEAARSGSPRLAEGDEVDLEVPPTVDAAPLVADPAVSFEVVHEDAHVVVVNKPPGVVVHPGAGNAEGTLVHGLLARYPELVGVGEPARPGIVHRLDRETSGLLVVARTETAHASLTAQLAAHTVARRYQALVWGAFEAPTGQVDAPIGRSRRHPTRMAVSADGREARTDYRVEATFVEPVEVSLLSCRLHTGRTHQIRVHLASIGRPVVGDETYGGVRSSLPVPRLWLHAAALGFDHPETGEHLELTAPLPADLAAVLDRLR